MLIKIIHYLIGYNPLEPDINKRYQFNADIETLGIVL